jgi:hypothetical protein
LSESVKTSIFGPSVVPLLLLFHRGFVSFLRGIVYIRSKKTKLKKDSFN